jgi:hypothetical protein
MEWIKTLSLLISSFAWPATIVILVTMFRREIRQRLRSLTEVKYPGGSITMSEVERLEARVESIQGPIVAPGSADSPAIPYTDSKLAIAQVRIDLERELFRLSSRALPNSEITEWHTSRHIAELETATAITSKFAQNLRSFIDVADRVINGVQVSSGVVDKTSAIAGDLLSTLRYKRLVYEAVHDFEAHGIWHMRRQLSANQTKKYLMSAVTSQLPEFAYDYSIYSDSLAIFNERQRSEHPRDELPVLSLKEFIECLEWRQKELQRLREDLPKVKWNETHDEANMWKWPLEWGELQWSTSILRDRVSSFNAEQDLMQTRAALERHRLRLHAEDRTAPSGA